MKKYLFVLILVFYCNHGFAQDIAALQQRAKYLKEDTAAVRTLTDLSNAFNVNNETDSSEKYALQALQLINNIIIKAGPDANKDFLYNCELLKANALSRIAEVLTNENIKAATDTFHSAILLRKSLGTKLGLGDDYFGLAYLYYVLRDYTTADSLYQLSIDVYKVVDDKNGLGTAYNWRAISLREMGNYGDALENNLQALSIGKQIKDSSILTDGYLAMGFIYMKAKLWDDALANQKAALTIFTARHDSLGIATAFNDMGAANMLAERYVLSLQNHKAALAIRLRYNNYSNISSSYSYISNIYDLQGNYKEALDNCFEGLKYAILGKDIRYISTAYQDAGSIYLKLKDTDNALKNYYKSLDIARENNADAPEAIALTMIADIYLHQLKIKDAIALLQQAVILVPKKDFATLQSIYEGMYKAYEEKGDYKNALQSHIIYMQYGDSVAAKEKAEKLASLTNQYALENKQVLLKANNDKQLAQKQTELQQQKLMRNFGFAGFFVVIILAIIFFIRFREKRKLNIALEKTLHDLQSTQKQLIHSEKMASLGELTAGIAHEIQNPLNFINNFSEVSNELIDELNEELNNSNTNEAKLISNDIKQNLEKITFHGRRADGIVKSMLQHSRKSSGQKELTEINALCDEYLRLSYHGLRAKDKSFNADFKTDLDETIGKIHVVRQDIGRVLLNLFNNAFYAVNERCKAEGERQNAGSSIYVPIVTVVTKRINDKTEIVVKDNGGGIPQDIIDKIFQPFFTTKPTGSGTGLGLSLTYDIIKAHGGEIRVETKVSEGNPDQFGKDEGTKFIIQLPA